MINIYLEVGNFKLYDLCISIIIYDTQRDEPKWF